MRVVEPRLIKCTHKDKTIEQNQKEELELNVIQF